MPRSRKSVEDSIINFLVGIALFVTFVIWIVWKILVALFTLVKIVVVGIAVLISYIGQSLVLAIENVAHGFRVIGIDSPTVSWIFLGCIIGASIGGAYGLHLAGKKSWVPRAYSIGTLVVAVLVIVGLKFNR